MIKPSMKLTVGGPVQVKYGTYLPRPADEQLLQAVQAGKFAYVLACRQIGKSSLMFETSRRLSGTGVRTVLIDLNGIGHYVEAENWYFSLVDETVRKLKLDVDVQAWWTARPHLSPPTQRFVQFLREVVLEKVSGPVVIFIDEIDVTLGLNFTDDFFAAIRAVYNERAQDPAYQRLTFVLLGVATPDELIKDHTRTPFNIGQGVTLGDFTREECQPFCTELEAGYPERGRAYFDRVYDWTGGHPYLTQKLCDALLRAEAGGLEGDESVDRLVHELFLAADARNEANIQFVQTRVTGDQHALEMLKIYHRVLGDGGKPVNDDEQSPAINRLKLYGLVVAENGKLKVRNKLYARAFDLAWTEEMQRLSSAGLKLGLPDHYKIIQEIGQGGFAVVYLAQFHDEEKTQSVALKVLKPAGLSNLDQVRRFKQEARAVARLAHPNIIKIMETSGETEPFFIAMQFIPGGTVRDRLKSGPLTRPEAIDIVRQIGSALAYAHERGIIHRDIKPENILLDSSYDPPRPVLTDFGLIKLLTTDTHTRIHSSSVLGTLDYMAPEQWRQEPPTPATDLYALAITFFEMLAGERPFGKPMSYYDLMNRHLETPLPRLSSVAPEVGPFFDEVLLRAAAKRPTARYESLPQFLAALEAANAEAEEAERQARLEQAAKTVDVARGYMQKGRYDPEKALYVLEIALETYPSYLDALRLRGRLHLRQEQFEAALADYRQAFEQVGDPALEAGLEYVETLNHVAGLLWQRQAYEEGAGHYEHILELLDRPLADTDPLRPFQQEARLHLIEYHHQAGHEAYAAGNPADTDAALGILEREILALTALAAETEGEDLKHKQRWLQVKKYQDVIEAEEAAINEFNKRSTHLRLSDESILPHYAALDEAFQHLLALEPDNEVWTAGRCERLKEKAEVHRFFARRAADKLDRPDYEAAIRHYRAILAIDQGKVPGLARALDLDLEEIIAGLEKKADHDGKYQEILTLIAAGDQARALERLDADFIREGNYGHREVGRLLWGLVYARSHEGNFPPEWDSMAGFDVLSKRLITIERDRLQKLKEMLEPWSQVRILEMVQAQNRHLQAYEEDIGAVEGLLRDLVARGMTETAEIAGYRAELAELRAHIQNQRTLIFQLDVPTTARQIDLWLEQITDIETLLKTGNPIKDIPEFCSRGDLLQQAVDEDEMFARLQRLVASGKDIGQAITGVKLRMREQLVPVLLEDVGRRDEAMARLEQEARQELAERQAEVSQTRAELAHLRPAHEQLGRLVRYYKIDKFLIPFSLAVALVAGGVVAPRLASLPGISQLGVAALVLLILYFGYYIWHYYIASLRDG